MSEKVNKTLTDYHAKMAADRVDAEENLREYLDILIDYQWHNQADHLRWVATAPIEEILDWAEIIRSGEEQEEEEKRSKA